MMAVDLRNSMLSSHSFSDDHLLPFSNTPFSTYYNPNQPSLCFGSSLSSPVNSEIGTESENDDEHGDYIAELTRQMTQYMLQDDDNHVAPSIVGSERQGKYWGLSGSPQSTLRSTMGWSSQGSSEGSSSQESSPPVTPVIAKDRTGDLPYDFLMEKMKINNDGFKHPPPNSIRDAVEDENTRFCSNPHLLYHQVRALRLNILKQEQEMKEEGSLYWRRQSNTIMGKSSEAHLNQFQNKNRACGGSVNGGRVRVNPLSHASDSWPTLQNQTSSGSGMRAVFLGGSGSRSGSCGTGVFLPRSNGNFSESPKKQGCSTVLIPARVVQALKLHFDKMGSQSRPNLDCFPLHQDDALMGGRNVMYSLQKSQSQTVPAMTQNELGLPQEWTY